MRPLAIIPWWYTVDVWGGGRDILNFTEGGNHPLGKLCYKNGLVLDKGLLHIISN